jgi:uncharacterized protein (DUF924 family)/uncharacterized protein YjiS (DUF1127 family)
MPTDLGDIMGIIKHAFGSLRRGVLALAAASGERRAIRMLRSFDSRALADIGVKRGEIDFAVRHGRPSEVQGDINVAPVWRASGRDQPGVPRKTLERVPPLHVILLLLGLAPVGALMMSWGPSATNASTGELRMYDNVDWHQVYNFWFPPDLEYADPETFRRKAEWWFGGGANAELQPFMHTLTAARSGRLDHWLATPRGRLALIIVLDQFPRGLFAGKADAYASDPHALRIAEEGLWNGHYDALTQPWEKTFFFLPMAHAEGPGHLHRLDRAVALAENVTLDAPERFRMYYQFSLSQARATRDLIARFGRYPHRNDILGRPSTLEEAEYVKTGNFVHLRRPPAERMPVAAE